MRRILTPPKTEREFDEFDYVSWLHESKTENEMCALAIDPGDAHIGVSIGLFSPDREQSVIVWSGEMEYQASIEFIQDCVNTNWINTLIVESFRLIPGRALAQSGSEMLTSQMIGAITKLVNNHNGKLEISPILFQLQPPSIKKTMKAVLRHYGIRPVPNGNSGHARDSQLHFWYYALHYEGIL